MIIKDPALLGRRAERIVNCTQFNAERVSRDLLPLPLPTNSAEELEKQLDEERKSLGC